MDNKVYSTLTIKAFDAETRTIRGIASTPTPDRSKDIVDPAGAEINLPIPFLMSHNHDDPIGHVTKAVVTPEGIEIEAQLVKIDGDSPLAVKLNDAWEAIKSGLFRGLSIGFRPIEYKPMKSGGVRFNKYEIYEISAVVIPANAEASITNIKQFSDESLGASTDDEIDQKTQPALRQKSVKLKPKKVKSKMNYKEMLEKLQATLAEKQAEVETIQKSVADEGRTKNADEREAFDTLMSEIESLELEIADVAKMVEVKKEAAKPVTEDQPQVAKQYSGIVLKSAPEKLEPGIRFARFVKCVGAAKGDLYTAERFAQKHYKQDEQLNAVIKSAVDAGTTQNMDKLVDYQIITSDFIDYLRPRTIIGRFGQGGIPGLRRVPFNIKVKSQDGTSTAGWVGEGQHKPVSKPSFNDVSLDYNKLAVISVMSEELLRFSNPAAEALVRDDLAEAVITEMDQAFIQVANGGSGTVKPKSITYAVNSGSVPSSQVGTAEARINTLWATADSSNFDVSGAVYITTPAVARKLAGLKNALDQTRFPNMTPMGGSIGGVPVIVSNHVDSGAFWLVFANEIFLADDGQVTIDASREASIIMSSTPQADVEQVDNDVHYMPQSVSMFQTNQVALRAERFITWKLRRNNVVNGELTGSWT